ncbi:MAG: YbaB/EbfC family nucleoid-associated protein [Micromonosporaceae bacterium]
MTSSLPDLEKKLLSVTATATSDDGLITATVGPRGQLVDLEIDAKIYRRPNSALLAQTILKTVRDAVDQGLSQTRGIIDDLTPKNFAAEQAARSGTPKGMPKDMLKQHDSELLESSELRGE